MFALFLRLAGIWRIEPIDYHPDEWVIAKPVVAIANNGEVGLKTHYKWPACSVIYLLGYGLYVLKGLFGPYSYETILIIQRVTSAIAGTLAVLVAFRLMRRLFSLRTAFISAILISMAMLPVQQGHYGTITSLVSLIILTVMLLSFDLFDIEPNRSLKTGKCCLLGLVCGLGIAAKWTVLFVVIPISGAFLLSIWANRILGNWGIFIKTNLKRIGIIAGITVLSFLAGFPDFYFAPKKVVSGLDYEIKHHQTGHYGSLLDSKKKLTPRLSSRTKSMISAGSKYLFIPSIAALLYCLVKPGREKLFLVWTMFFWFAMLCKNKLAATRHHLIPFIIMILLLSVGLSILLENRRKLIKYTGYIILVLLLCIEMLYTCIYISPFWKPDARTECSKWIKANVPKGSGVTWAPRTPIWAAPGKVVDPSLFKLYPQNATKNREQYIIAAISRLNIFKKHPPFRPVVPSEWFPQKPPSKNELILYHEMNQENGQHLTLVKKFHAKPGFWGCDLRLFGLNPNTDTTFANQSVSLFKFKGVQNR
jgi:hypothetical protein